MMTDLTDTIFTLSISGMNPDGDFFQSNIQIMGDLSK